MKKLAVSNIAQYGDTDIFPYPIENALLYDKSEEVCNLISKIDNDFNEFISHYPVEKFSTCIPVGLTGFRWATQIDPLWNAYLLYLVLSVSENIEKKRIPISQNSVFSYRLAINKTTGKLFSETIGWRSFIETTIKVAESENFTHVIQLDISDFYTRIYHHRLENALRRTGGNINTIKRIMRILQDLAGNSSYGLPIGGNSARLLAELLLTDLDSMLSIKNIRFCRFVDDFIVFAKSKEESFRILNFIADFLLRNEGLSIQKSKTQVLSSSEYANQAKHLLLGSDDDVPSKTRSNFLNLRIKYDPYSDTAEEDYENLKIEISKFNIVSLLIEEVRKSRIHQALGRQLLNAVYFLNDMQIGLAFNTISSNPDAFYPIFSSVLRLANKCLHKVPEPYKNEFVTFLTSLINNDSYMVQNDNTLAYSVRALSKSDSEIAQQAIDRAFLKTTSPLVKANCIYAMANRKCLFWISNLKSQFVTMTRQERRAFIAASYFLDDEGKHWRDHTKEQFLEFEFIVRDWVAEKMQSHKGWILPI
jgi:hypothetical protein